MEEKIIKEAKAGYFKSATKLYNGTLILTDKRILFSGEHARLQVNHGLVGNMVRNKLEKTMGYDKADESLIEIPLADVQHQLKRFGFTKRLVLKDGSGQIYNLQLLNRKEQPEWQDAIDSARVNT